MNVRTKSVLFALFVVALNWKWYRLEQDASGSASATNIDGAALWAQISALALAIYLLLAVNASIVAPDLSLAAAVRVCRE